MSDGLLEQRKDHHIDVVLREDVGSRGVATGLGRYALEYDALPELDFDEIDLTVEVFGKRLSAPIVIGAMTGGTARAGRINRVLGRAAAQAGVGLALGSQRAMIAKPALAETFAAKAEAPDLPLLFGNVGAVQLNYGVGVEEVRAALEAVGADALNLHLNALQEAVQPEGDTNFAGLGPKIAELCEGLQGVPCLAKEVGAGIGRKAAKRLGALPLAGVESAGVGGTSWAKVESYRAPAESAQAEVGRRLAGFGIDTAESIQYCRAAFGDRVVVGSGGVRTGMDVAVAIALGADLAALATPFLAAAEDGEEAVLRVLETLVYELRTICFCTGSRNLHELRDVAIRTV
jgi:isopentenyl-diphosphate delta-isomerase